MMSPLEAQYLARDAAMLPLYEDLKQAVEALVGAFDVNVKKTQIAFRKRYNFAVVSFPYRRIKGWPAHCLVLTLGLPRRLEDARIVQQADIRPGLYIHHTLLETPADIDDTLLAWVREAHDYAMRNVR